MDINDFKRKGTLTAALVSSLSREDLARLTNEMVDNVLAMIAECEDADVTFVPDDPEAYDAAAKTEQEVEMAWTLGHVIVHITASSEEASAIAAEMARGVADRGGRSRYEVPWQSVITIAQCRRRLEESRRMRLASLAMWPDEPHLDNLYALWNGIETNAVGRFLSGLRHAASHLDQIEDIISQARAARAGAD